MLTSQRAAWRAALLGACAWPAVGPAAVAPPAPTIDTVIVTAKAPAFDARNLADKAYVSNVQPVTQASAGSAAYWPGDGRSVYGGLTWSF